MTITAPGYGGVDDPSETISEAMARLYHHCPFSFRQTRELFAGPDLLSSDQTRHRLY